MNAAQVVEAIRSGNVRIPDTVSPEARDLILQLLHPVR